MNLAGVIYILGNDTEDLNQNDISERKIEPERDDHGEAEG